MGGGSVMVIGYLKRGWGGAWGWGWGREMGLGC